MNVVVDDKALRKFVQDLEINIPTRVADKSGDFIAQRARENLSGVHWNGELEDSISKPPAMNKTCVVEATAPYAWRFEEGWTGWEPQSALLLKWADYRAGRKLVSRILAEKGINVDYSEKGRATEFMGKASRSLDENKAATYVEESIKEVT